MAAFFSKTFASAGNRKTFTISTWLKITNISTATGQSIFYGDTAGSTNGTNDDFYYANNKIYFGGYNSTYIISTALFRDVSAWYHVVLSVDTTQATSANRIKLYVNGVEQARTEGAGYPAQNFDTAFIKSGAFQICGNSPASGFGLFNLASYYYIDGTALTPSSFGETDATTGIWKPKSYSGSYGTNGFFLKFENSASLGTDSSGNGNNFTVNGTPTQTVDTPSNNFATLNPLSNSGSGIFLYGNLYYDGNNTDDWSKSISATLAVSKGKWYWEAKATSATDAEYEQLGVAKIDKLAGYTSAVYNSDFANMVQLHPSTPTITKAVGANYYLSSGLTTNDTIMMALDMDNGRMWIGKNGTWFANSSGNTGSPSAGTYPVWDTAEFTVGETYVPIVVNYYAAKLTFNFGSGFFNTTAITSPVSDTAGLGKFQYAVPAGYYSLCTKNINSQG
jgi:hypothetical protein